MCAGHIVVGQPLAGFSTEDRRVGISEFMHWQGLSPACIFQQPDGALLMEAASAFMRVMGRAAAGDTSGGRGGRGA